MNIKKSDSVKELTTKQSVIGYWNKEWRENPDELSSPGAFMAFTRLHADLTQVTQVLDVGCGKYGTACDLDYADNQIQKSMVNLDVSSEALMLAKRHKSRSRSTFEYIQGNATQLCFRSASFDMVTTFATISLLGREYIYALQDMWRVTRNYLVFDVTYKGTLPPEQGEPIQRISLDERGIKKALASLSPKPTDVVTHTFTLGELAALDGDGPLYYKDQSRKVAIIVLLRK